MNAEEFSKGLDVLTACGIMNDIEPEKIIVWQRLLYNLDFEYYEKAIIQICQTNVDFFPGTNIPGLIRKAANEIRSKEFQKAKRIEQEKYFKQCRLEAVPALKAQ
jgi:hypothetical protein